MVCGCGDLETKFAGVYMRFLSTKFATFLEDLRHGSGALGVSHVVPVERPSDPVCRWLHAEANELCNFETFRTLWTLGCTRLMLGGDGSQAVT